MGGRERGGQRVCERKREIVREINTELNYMDIHVHTRIWHACYLYGYGPGWRNYYLCSKLHKQLLRPYQCISRRSRITVESTASIVYIHTNPKLKINVPAYSYTYLSHCIRSDARLVDSPSCLSPALSQSLLFLLPPRNFYKCTCTHRYVHMHTHSHTLFSMHTHTHSSQTLPVCCPTLHVP